MKQYPSAVVEVTRGHENNQRVESRHLIDIVIADASGKIVQSWGEAERGVFPRSAIKALQALPLIESGAADAYGFEDKHLALACSSHNGEEIHTSTATEMLERAGLEPRCLECGAQLPERLADRKKLTRKNSTPTALHNNCSGKHSGFLAVCTHEGIETTGYVKFEHKFQKLIAKTLTETTGAAHEEDNYGIDGCSIPTYEIPLEKLAIAYARFGVGENGDSVRAKAMLRLRDACMTHPEMVAGTNRFDTILMQALGNRALTKTGAEGVFTTCLPELGFGIALKCHDGQTRAAEVVCAAVIESLLELSQDEASTLKWLSNRVLKNWNGLTVGSLKMQSKIP